MEKIKDKNICARKRVNPFKQHLSVALYSYNTLRGANKQKNYLLLFLLFCIMFATAHADIFTKRVFHSELSNPERQNKIKEISYTRLTNHSNPEQNTILFKKDPIFQPAKLQETHLHSQIKKHLKERKIDKVPIKYSPVEEENGLVHNRILKDAISKVLDLIQSSPVLYKDFSSIAPKNMHYSLFLKYFFGINNLTPLENYAVLEIIFRLAINSKRIVLYYENSSGDICARSMDIFNAAYYTFSTAYSGQRFKEIDLSLEVYTDIYKMLDAFYKNKKFYMDVCPFEAANLITKKWYSKCFIKLSNMSLYKRKTLLYASRIKTFLWASILYIKSHINNLLLRMFF